MCLGFCGRLTTDLPALLAFPPHGLLEFVIWLVIFDPFLLPPGEFSNIFKALCQLKSSSPIWNVSPYSVTAWLAVVLRTRCVCCLTPWCLISLHTVSESSEEISSLPCCFSSVLWVSKVWPLPFSEFNMSQCYSFSLPRRKPNIHT